MFFFPNHIITSLEFDKVLKLAQSFCFGPLGTEHFNSLHLSIDPEVINSQLEAVDEFKKILLSPNPLTLGSYESIETEVSYLSVSGYVLSLESVVKIDNLIRLSNGVYKFFSGERSLKYPQLTESAKLFFVPEELFLGLDKVLDESGEIRPDASPELHAIHKSIHSKTLEINKKFNGVAQKYKEQGLLSDAFESYRNNRRVLSVPAEHKRKIRGIIHDDSATGKTVFIEPEELITTNNELFDLESDYKKEIYKILRKLSDKLRPYGSQLLGFYHQIGSFDILYAKAAMAVSMNANRVNVVDKAHFGYKKAFHPLLYLKNRQTGLKVVPFGLELHKPNKIIILSGPNAGGKSVTMKTVGLLQLMIQSGMLITANENSTVGIFHQIVADIGDQQSLEDDLSTYSSRLVTMKALLDKAEKRTLFLIDEFGSGTDPQIGGAIAEAVLRALNKSKAFGLITTHYSNLKFYAYKTPGIVNASMLFDQENLKPTYEFELGKPGSSYAFEIAQQSGLDKEILKYARFKTGKNVKRIEDLVIELQTEKQILEKKLDELLEKEKKIDLLIKNYDHLYKDLDYRRAKLKLEKKEFALVDINKKNKELNDAIREIKTEKKLEEAIALAKKLEEDKKKLEVEAEKLDQAVLDSTGHLWKHLKAGDYAKLKTGGETGKITAIMNKKAEIELGHISMTVKLSDLIPTDKPISKNSGVKIVTSLESGSKFETKIDIRGYSKTDAMDAIQEFLDNAILANANFLQILHGKGNGVLRKMVKEIVKEYRDVKEISHPAEENGGNGITIITLK